MHKLATAAMPQLDSFGSQEFSNLARACTTVASVKIPLLGAMAGAICTSPRPLELSNGARASASAQLAGTTLAQRPAQLAPIGGGFHQRAWPSPRGRRPSRSSGARPSPRPRRPRRRARSLTSLRRRVPHAALDVAAGGAGLGSFPVQGAARDGPVPQRLAGGGGAAGAERLGGGAAATDWAAQPGAACQDPENPDANRRTE
ncbi:unnamed protein product [Effrenium voratum]|uniref:Uncharacterized protein n=1 Tax=Effrenium voratum TaxID=2562239 RepID=A0AA36HP60_9DINO|nr:unnamed protein product [Effrenium voratum]